MKIWPYWNYQQNTKNERLFYSCQHFFQTKLLYQQFIIIRHNDLCLTI